MERSDQPSPTPHTNRRAGPHVIFRRLARATVACAPPIYKDMVLLCFLRENGAREGPFPHTTKPNSQTGKDPQGRDWRAKGPRGEEKERSGPMHAGWVVGGGTRMRGGKPLCSALPGGARGAEDAGEQLRHDSGAVSFRQVAHVRQH